MIACKFGESIKAQKSTCQTKKKSLFLDFYLWWLLLVLVICTHHWTLLFVLFPQLVKHVVALEKRKRGTSWKREWKGACVGFSIFFNHILDKYSFDFRF